MKKFRAAAALAAALTAASTSAYATGILTDIAYRAGLINKPTAKVIDGFNAEAKKAIPSYGEAEKKVTNDVRESIGLERH